MTTKELKIEIIKSYLNDWVDGKWFFNEDWSVDVIGDVILDQYVYPFPKLPCKFDNVSGDFVVSYNSLKSLDNFPNRIGGGIYTFGNPFYNNPEHLEYIKLVKCKHEDEN